MSRVTLGHLPSLLSPEDGLWVCPAATVKPRLQAHLRLSSIDGCFMADGGGIQERKRGLGQKHIFFDILLKTRGSRCAWPRVEGAPVSPRENPGPGSKHLFPHEGRPRAARPARPRHNLQCTLGAEPSRLDSRGPCSSACSRPRAPGSGRRGASRTPAHPSLHKGRLPTEGRKAGVECTPFSAHLDTFIQCQKYWCGRQSAPEGTQAKSSHRAPRPVLPVTRLMCSVLPVLRVASQGHATAFVSHTAPA